MSGLPRTIPDEELTDWRRNPTTEGVREGLEYEVERNLKRVLGAAKVSSDPAVRDAVVAYGTYSRMLKLFQESHGEPETESDRSDDEA